MEKNVQRSAGHNAAVYLHQAFTLYQAGGLQEAEAICREVLRLYRHHPDASHLIALIAHGGGSTEQALRTVDRALKHSPRHPLLLNSRGMFLASLGKHKEAVLSFRSAIAYRPDFPVARGNLLKSLVKTNRHEDTIKEANIYISMASSDANAHYLKGYVLQEMNRLLDAKASYDEALALNPRHSEALNNRGLILSALGFHNEALADYDAATNSQPDFPEALNNKGVMLENLGRHEEALAAFEQATRSKPDFFGALSNLAGIYHIHGRQRDAFAAIQRCIQLAPNDLSARLQHLIFHLPILYEKTGDIAQARTAYETELHQLCKGLENVNDLGEHEHAVGIGLPFFLAYQGINNHALQSRYGSLMCEISARAGTSLCRTSPPPPAR